jgi:hypothetical protein
MGELPGEVQEDGGGRYEEHGSDEKDGGRYATQRHELRRDFISYRGETGQPPFRIDRDESWS